MLNPRLTEVVATDDDDVMNRNLPGFSIVRCIRRRIILIKNTNSPHVLVWFG